MASNTDHPHGARTRLAAHTNGNLEASDAQCVPMVFMMKIRSPHDRKVIVDRGLAMFGAEAPMASAPRCLQSRQFSQTS
jgi:hypothetical protein